MLTRQRAQRWPGQPRPICRYTSLSGHGHAEARLLGGPYRSNTIAFTIASMLAPPAERRSIPPPASDTTGRGRGRAILSGALEGKGRWRRGRSRPMSAR